MALLQDSFTFDERAQLQAAFLRLIPHSDEMAKSLYAHLFERVPEVRELFPEDMEEQRDKLVRMLAAMVDSLNRPEEFAQMCRESGKRHREYGTKPEHFGPLGESLIDALRETLVPPPGPEEEALWIKLYGSVARLMTG